MLATALAVWRPPALPPATPDEPAAEASPEPEPPPPAPEPAPPSPATVPQIADTALASPLIARAPLDVRARPVRVSPAPLYKNWRFWAVAGGLFAAMVATTLIVTRPDPPPYTGNTYPYYVSFP